MEETPLLPHNKKKKKENVNTFYLNNNQEPGSPFV